jgi:hypothetical protein
LRLAGLDPFAGLLLLMGREFRLPAEFDALFPGVGPAARSALDDASAIQLAGDTQHGKHKLGKVRGCIDNRLGNRAQACAGALDVAGDHQKIRSIARDAVNSRGDDNIARGESFYELAQLRPVGSGAGDLLMDRLFTPGGREFGELVGKVLGGRRDARIAG